LQGGIKVKKVRIIVLLLVFVLVMSFAGCGKYLSKSKAMDVAMKDLGLIQINVSDLNAGLDKDSDPAIYKVSFVYASQDYTYVINAESGAIISKDITQ
jgi:uncharacterized membrane protein YkoI